MSQWLNYHHLYYFWTIAREGSISKASEKLLLGQPTLSTQLKQFEDQLGVDLFDRRNRKMILTESGKVALNYAEEIFRLGSELQDALNDRLSPHRVQVQIGALDSVPKSILSQLVMSITSAGRGTVSVFEGRGDELFRELNAHQLDLIVSNFPPPTGAETLYAKSVGKLPVQLYGATGFANLKKDFPKSLEGQPFIMPTKHSKLRHDLDHYFKVNEVRVEIVAETQDTSLQVMLGIQGMGVLALSEKALVGNSAKKELGLIGTFANVTEEIWLIAGARKIENPLAAQIMKEFSIR